MSVTSKTSGSAGSSASCQSRQTPPNNRSWQTERRLRALALYQKGWQQNRIAEALGVTKGAVSQWLKKARDLPEEEQERALTVKKSTGRKPVVTADLQRKLLAIIDRSAESFGFVGDLWTATRLQTVIRRELGIRLGVTTIKKFLHQEGYSVQKPVVSATQKNEKAVAGFRGGWVNLKKGQPKQARP